jgi:ribonucleoside-diphosphate reductase alpha chain
LNITNPYAEINFIPRKALISDKDGNIIYENDVIFPDYYSDNSVNITSSKYFFKSDQYEEKDIRQMIDRVSDTLAQWGIKQEYFDEKESIVFSNKLKKYQIEQLFAFNSPVYFNVGVTDKVQASACFILDIEDSMESIANVGVVESKIFKRGSGSGMNISPLRSKYEHIANSKGCASGCVSFLKVHDIFGGVIRSGGSLRRSAKLVCLNIDHPDIEEFIDCKKYEEEKIKVLKKGGIQSRKGYEISDEVFFQNTNLSVRIPDSFMKEVLNNGVWETKFVITGETHKIYRARDLLYRIAERSWECADPGVQFHDNVNKWNTCSNDGEIVSTNPCGEYAFLNNSACNLASVNLLKFFKFKESNSYQFDFKLFEDVVNTIITAQDIIIDIAEYPAEKITENSKKYRPLGLGYTNLGALLTYLGLPYDSDAGRNFAAHITAILTGCALLQSHSLTLKKGPFERFENNKDSYYNVLKKHSLEVEKLHPTEKIKPSKIVLDGLTALHLNQISESIWDEIIQLVETESSFRNAQVTLLAPTGTISFLMDAQTTGIEPEFSHVKYKRLSNTEGGIMTFANPLVHSCLSNLGYSKKGIKEIECFIEENKQLSKCESLQPDDLKIFETAVSNYSDQVIDYSGHIRMVAAVQPFISGAISKTTNLPNSATIEDIFKCYLECWKLGLKGITVYRDGSKDYQPLSTTRDELEETDLDDIIDENISINDIKQDDRLIKHLHALLAERKLPPERPAITYKFNVGGVKGFLTCGLYEDGDLGEIFINISKEGSTLSGLLDCLATVVSISLQKGVPLKDIVEKMTWQKFEPYGFTTDKNIKTATSIVDFIFKYLGMKFLDKKDQVELRLIKEDALVDFDEVFENSKEETKPITDNFNRSMLNTFAGPSCNNCGSIMVKKGNCFLCLNCGNNNGACG